MALVTQNILEDAKKKKATTTTTVNKLTPGISGLKQTKATPAKSTGVTPKVNTTVTKSIEKSASAKPTSAKQTKHVNNSSSAVTNVLNKVKESQGKTVPSTGLTPNKGYTERLKDLRPQEETSQELKSVVEQLNKNYKINPYSALYDPNTQALEKRRQELINEEKLQSEKKDLVTIPEYQKAYEEALAKGDKEEANRINEIIDALDDSTLERVGKSFSAAGRNAFADIMGSVEELKDISYEKDALGYEEQYKRALAEGKTEEAEYYKMRAEESRKRADSYDALDESHWAVQLRNESQHIMELERIGASGTEMLMMETGDNIANMLPTVAASAIPGVGSFSMAMFVPQVFSSVYANNIKNGYDIQTSASNAALSAAVEFVAEEIGTITGFAIKNTPLNNVFSRVMDTSVGRMWGAMMANSIIQDPISEGNEELFSGLIQPIIDHYTLGTDIEYSFGDLSHAWIMGALTSAIMNTPQMVSTHISSSRQANFLKAEMEMINEAVPEGYEQANSIARRVAENALAEFREKSITAEAIKLESEQAEVPSVNELLVQYAEFMKPTEDAYQKKMQESVEKVNAIEQQRLHEKGVDIDAGVWALLDSKTKQDILSFTEKDLDIDYGDYITNNDANYRKAMVDIAESNALLSVENKTGKFNTELFASLPSETQDSIKKLSSKFNKGTGPSLAFGFFTGSESGMNAKYDKANNAIVVNLNQTRAIDVDALADIADEAYTDIKNAGVNEIFYKSGFASTFANAVAHEFTHSAEGTTEYDKVVELARSEMGADRYERAKSRLNEYYESRNADPGDNSEIVAHYIQKNVDSEDFMEKLYKYNDSAFYRIYDNMLSLVSGNEKTKLENALRKAIYKANNPSDSFAMQYSTGLALNPEYQVSQSPAEKVESQYSSGTAKRITDINDPQYYTRSNLELGNPIEVVDYPKSNQQLSGKTDVKSFFDTMITNAVNSGATEYRRGLGAYFDVVNNDTGDKVGVTDNVVNEAIAHHGNTFVTSSLLNLNPLLENAVLVNKSTNGRDVFDVYFTHARFGGNDTLIRIIAKNSTVVDVDSMAYAVSTSRGDSALVTKNSTLPSSGKKNGGVFDTITIANLLQEVNKTRFRGNLSKDVQSSLNSGVVIPNPDPKYTNLYSIGLDSNQKQTQFDILQSANPMTDDYHTGIRSVDDIHTFEEVNQSMEDVTPDFTAEDIRQAIDDGYVTVYSSNPIQNGTFVTPSLMEAKNYAGDGKIYSQRVSLDQVAWIDSVEGQYADTSNYEAERFDKEEIDLKPLTQEKPYNISKNTVQFSVGMYEHGGREVLEDYIKNNPDIEGGEDIVKRVDEIAQVMKDFAETGKYPSFSKWQDQYYAINEKGELSVVISNGDYDLNIDFSTVCKKRKMMDKVINKLSESGYLDATLRPDMIAEVRKTIQDHGMEVACGLCFVDAKRFNQGNWAGRFESKWNGLIDQLAGIVDTDDVRTFDYVRGQTQASESLANIDFSDPRFAEFVEKSKGSSEEAKMARALINDPSLRAYVSRNDMYGSEGFSSIRDNNPELYKLVNASGGSSKPKLAHGEVNFRNEIILDNGFNEQAAREVGGVRFQSFSDFMTNMVFDYVQAFSELEAKNLPAHSYTKVKEYALLFGKTGMKINLSIIPAAFDSNAYTAEQIADMRKNDKRSFNQLRENAGLDANGNYIFDPESFDWDLAVEISNLDGYDKNVGTICVGVSYNHIVKMLGDDNVQMVIPYHRSGINPIVADKMGISLYNDYTLKQNTRFRKENGKPGKKIGKSFDFDFYKGKDANGKHYPGMIELGYDAKAATNSYLQWCEESNYVPKFDEFAWHENYYKLLIDFRAYDKYGNVAPQEAVKISGDNFGSFDGEIRPTDIIDPSVSPALAKLYGDNISFNNVLQHGLDLNEGIEYEQDSQLDAITNEVIEKLKLKPNEKYSIGIDSQGRELSPNQREFYKDSKAVDENGNLLRLYHGTPKGGFSVFDSSFSDDKRSLFFTDDPEVADTYNGGRNRSSIYPVYLNLKNPLIIDAKGASWNQIQNGEIKNLVANRNTIGDFTFLNEEDANSFEQKYHIQELTDLLEEARKNGSVEYNGETYDDWEIRDLLDNAEYNAEREYQKYHRNNSKSITIKEFLDNYKDYGWYDLESLQDTYDDNGPSLLEIKEYADNDYDKAVQSYIDFFKNEIGEGNTDSSVYDISFDALPKSGESFEKKDLHNTRWFSEQAQKQGYDGVIFKNLIDRVYGNGASTVAVAFDSNQVKSVFNSNPTSNKDIRYSMGIEAEKPDYLDISDEEFNKFVKRDPISPRALENITKHKKELVDTAPEWIPNYDIIREKHPEFTDLEMNDALFEILSEGTISESTAWRIKEDMLRRNSVQTNNEADQSIKELVDDSLDYFAADAAYKMNKKAMNSVANKANTIIRSFTGQNVTEGALDSYEQMEGLEKTLKQVEKRRTEVSAKNETMVKELLAAGADYGSSWMTLEQNLDKIAGTNSNLRQTLRDYFELPKYESQIKYVQFLQKYGDTLQGLVKDGIRAGTKESAAVQYMLEGHREDGSKYTQKDLMEQFPDSWEKLEKASKTLREMYDEMYQLIETNRENTYGDIDAKYDLQLAKARDKANNARRTADQIKQKLSVKADARLEAMFNRADAEASKLERQYEQMLEDKATRDGTRRQKLQYRKNYAHHLTDQGGFFKQMKNALSDGSSVPTKLSGISNRAKPLSGFASFFQRQNAQTGYVADAIGGMAEYIKDASKIYAYDPYIEYLRFAASDIRAEASGNEMSRFVSWVDNYANGIAGKTQMLDRGVRETFGEKPLKVIKTLNNQARKNAIVGNLSTALVQFANLPNAIGVLSQYGGAESSVDIARGLSAYASTLGREGAESVSPFMSARYYDINTQKGNVAQRSLNGIAKTLLEFGDHEAAKMIWNCSYQQALRLNVDDPIMYADDLTRRSIAGRSVSELPLAMESQVLKLLMPFQVETNNTFHLMTGLMRDKKLGSLLAMLIGGWLMNGLYEAVIGRRPITDPIDAILDAKESDNPADIATRLGGELLSAIPGSSYAVSLFGLNDNQRKKLFGENDPSRYGTGNIGLSTLGSATMDIYNAFDKKDPRYAMNAVSDLASTYLAPGGGRQIQRTVEGLQSEGMIPQYVNGEWVNEPRYYTPSGKVGFVNDPNDVFDVITAGTFGRWATKEGKAYLENGGKYLSDQATRQLEALGGDSEAYNAVIAMRDMQGIPGVDNSKALQKRKYLEDQGLWDTFAENMDGEWGDYGLNKTVGNASEEEFNKLYSEVFGNEDMKLDVASAAGMKETLDTEEKESKSSSKDANLDFLAGTPYEKAAIQNLDMDEDVLQTVTDLGYDYKTIKQIDDYIDNTESLKDANGKTVRNSKALQMRQQYEELGVYDDIFSYISENGLDPADYGLNKTVMGYSDSKFESQYNKVYGGGSSGSSSSSKSSSKSSGSSSRRKSSSKKSKKKGFSSEEEMKAFFDQLVANIGLSSSKSSSSTISNILKKSKNLRNTKFSKRSSS